MSGVNSVEAVKRKIRVLQQQADDAEERAESLQRRVEEEKRTREQVKDVSRYIPVLFTTLYIALYECTNLPFTMVFNCVLF